MYTCISPCVAIGANFKDGDEITEGVYNTLPIEARKNFKRKVADDDSIFNGIPSGNGSINDGSVAEAPLPNVSESESFPGFGHGGHGFDGGGASGGWSHSSSHSSHDSSSHDSGSSHSSGDSGGGDSGGGGGD